MKIYLDWETSDPYISLGYGPGWVFGLLNYSNPEFKLLGCSIRTDEDEKSIYYTNLESIADIIEQADYIVNHNCMYDVGCTLVMFHVLDRNWGTYSTTKFHDTIIMAKLVDQDQFSYSLESCSRRYGGVEKSKSTLTDYVWNSGMYQAWYKETRNRNSRTRPSEDTLFSFAIKNLEHIPEEIVGDYCNYDVDATYDLYKNLYKELQTHSKLDLDFYSDLIKACVEIKKRGVCIDLGKARSSKKLLNELHDKLLNEIYAEVGKEFNINSPVQLVEALKSVGIIDFPKTEKGNDSANKIWLEEQPQTICKKIVKTRNYAKLSNDFIEKLIRYQNIHIDNNSSKYKIFPNFNILGASKTGRMSSSGYRSDSLELNFQQIPKRGDDKEASKYVRGIFIADEGEEWIGADYSNQEQRLQVDFASKYGLKSAEPLVNQLKSDPFSDFHQIVANICGIERTPAKTINLGLSYSMGQAKLCKSLGLPTKWAQTSHGIREVAGREGESILKKYHKFLPFMKELQEIASKALTYDGFITTLGGRRLHLDKSIWYGTKEQSFEYKGLSKLVQGSAADMTMQAVVNCYKNGLKILLIVHDEICISSKDPVRDTQLLRNCMENTYETQVPMVVEISRGASWSD